jgi:hypothetical protein
MNEMRICLIARAGCWGLRVKVDGRLVSERFHHCFTDLRKALEQALEDVRVVHATWEGGAS